MIHVHAATAGRPSRTSTPAATHVEGLRLQRMIARSPGDSVDVDAMLALQRQTGNRAVSLFVQRAIDLTDHEDAMGPEKGHALAQHVNVDNAYLKARGKPMATRFRDLSTANTMADHAVADNGIKTKIEAMKAGTRPNASGGVASGENGIAYVKAADKYYKSKNLLIEIYPYTGTKEPLKSLGWYIMTMYPKDSTGVEAT